MTKPHRLRILHLSDLHARVALDWMPAERKNLIRVNQASRERVLGAELRKALTEIATEGAVDLLCFTGDLADWGLGEEMEKMNVTLREICEVLALPPDRVYPVPGNHDVSRKTNEDQWHELRKLIAERSDVRDGLGQWLAKAGAPSSVPPALVTQVLARQDAYWQWVAISLKRPDLVPGTNTRNHPALGYRFEQHFDRLPFPVQIIGLNTAWLSGDDHDAGKLALTLGQVDLLCHDEGGKSLLGFRLALMHHPLGSLADSDRFAVQPVLGKQVDLLLHGHQHDPEAQDHKSPDSSLRVLAAGSLYEGDQGDRWVNSFHVIDARLDDDGHPQGYDITFYGWSPSGHWHRTSAFYEGAKDGRLSWPVVQGWRSPREPAAPYPRTHSTLEHAPAICVARDTEIAALTAALCDPSPRPVSVCSLHGMAGVGKTRLIEHFYRLNPDRFQRYLSFALSATTPTDQAALFDSLWGQTGLRDAPSADRLREHLAGSRTLLHIENVDSRELAVAVAHLVESLIPAPIVVSGRYDGFGDGTRWRVLRVKPFDIAGGLAQIEQEMAPARLLTIDVGARTNLVRALGGLPLAIHIAASYLNKGRSVAAFLALLRERDGDLGPIDVNDSAYASRSVQTLNATFEISRQLFAESERAAGRGGADWLLRVAATPRAGFGVSQAAMLIAMSAADAENRLSDAVDYGLVERRPIAAIPGWLVHPLMAEYLASVAGAARQLEARALVDRWFLERLLRGDEDPLAPNQRAELDQERPGLVEWLQSAVPLHAAQLAISGFDAARQLGPFGVWVRVLDAAIAESSTPLQRSLLLWRKGTLAFSGGDLVAAQAAAIEARDEAIKSGAVGARDAALASGIIADVLTVRGQLDEALRIRTKQQLPVYEKLGDVRSRAVTMGKIADILEERGQLDEVLRIRTEQLQVYEKLGDAHARAVTIGKIGDILQARGKFDEALRIRTDEQLPVYEKLGDARGRAVTMGKIADILQARGELVEAWRIRTEEQLPAYEKLGDVRLHAATMGQIAYLLEARGEFDEALRILRDELVPVSEKLGDVRLRAATMVQIAYILQARGERDEALRILREELVPVFEKLGDVRSCAVTKGRIADILQARGELDEALRIRQEDELPVYEKLGDVRERLNTEVKVGQVYVLKGEIARARQLWRKALVDAERMRIPDAKAITEFLAELPPE